MEVFVIHQVYTHAEHALLGVASTFEKAQSICMALLQAQATPYDMPTYHHWLEEKTGKWYLQQELHGFAKSDVYCVTQVTVQE